jgi:hypothetical protein
MDHDGGRTKKNDAVEDQNDSHIQKDKPHFQTLVWSWTEHKSDHVSQRRSEEKWPNWRYHQIFAWLHWNRKSMVSRGLSGRLAAFSLDCIVRSCYLATDNDNIITGGSICAVHVLTWRVCNMRNIYS